MSLEKHVPRFKQELKAVGGVLLPKSDLFPDEKCLSGLSYTPDPGDIFIVTYPKSGTTWTQYIVWEILNFGAPPPGVNDMLRTYVPFLENTGRGPVDKLSVPRAIKTHLPHHLQPYHPFAKYIYIARNPKDTCISYYHHTKEMPSVFNYTGGSLDDYFESFLLGDVAYGDWFNHVLSWYVHKDDPNVLFLTYEMMKRDPAGHILRIAQFIGKEYEDRIRNDPTLLERILEITSFQNMKKMDMYIPKESPSAFKKMISLSQVPSEEENFYKVNFFWRGKVGNWKEFLSQEQVERLNEMILSRPRGKEIAALWDE